MPDKPDPQSQTPRPSRPNLANLSQETTEDDLWVLDDDDRAPAPERSATPAGSDPPPAPSTEQPAASASPDAPAAGESAGAENKPQTDDEAAQVEAPAEETEALPAAPKPTADSSGADRPADGATKPKRRELIALGIFVVIGLAAAIWWISGLFSDVSTTRLGDDEPSLPIEGEYATLGAVETGWRAPVGTGPDIDIARQDVLFVPTVTIELEEGGQGVLRAIFRDDLNEFVGDSINRRFAGGKFERSGTATTEFPATSGFADQSQMSGYRFGEDRWTVEIYEAPSANAPGSELNLLLKMPIHPVER